MTVRSIEQTVDPDEFYDPDNEVNASASCHRFCEMLTADYLACWPEAKISVKNTVGQEFPELDIDCDNRDEELDVQEIVIDRWNHGGFYEFNDGSVLPEMGNTAAHLEKGT